MIKLVSIFFIFAFSANVALANEIAQFVFTTNTQTIKPNEISETITIQAQDVGGIAVSAGKTLCLKITSTSSTGEFSSNSSDWVPVNVLTINSNWKSRNFYYKDSIAGNYRIDAQVAIKTDERTCSAWPTNEWDIKWSANQNIVVSLDSSSSASQASSYSQSSSVSPTPSIVSGSVSYVFKSEQISAKAGGDKTAIVGADIVFEGKAYGFKNEPLEKARYFWTLGDGSYKEGQNIRHVYKYTGNYIVVLNASSGDISASDRVNVKVIPNELQIVETKNEFIKLKNKSDLILDLSGWFLRANGTVFNFPDYSLISANAELIISSDVSGLKFANNDFSAEILYPNGSPAFYYKMPVIISSQSLSLISSVKSKEFIVPQSLIKKTDIKSAGKTQSTPTLLSNATSSKIFIAENNLANVIVIGKKDEQGSVWWLILAGLAGIIGGAVIFLAKKFE
ncbi:MAG: PKD domain-containing protein [Patescibacteria group bacterium]